MRFVSSRFLRLLAIATAFALCNAFVSAQQTLGGITGEVADASGGVIPNVTVTVVDEQTSLTRTTTTNGSGTYQFVNLPIGTYTLTFKRLTGPPFASHLHMGKPGASGPIVVPLCASPKTCKSPIKGSKSLTKSFIAAMRKGDAYVNIHTVKNAGGEIRGLIKVG